MKQTEYARRRRQLMGMMAQGDIAILPASPAKLRNRDVEYPYRPDSDFYYLTGFAEPEAVAVLVPGRTGGEYLLFCRERNAEMETWHGDRAGPENAVRVHGADDAFPIGDIDDILPGIIERCERMYYTLGVHTEFDQRVLHWVTALREQGGGHTPAEFVALDHLLHDLRLFKSRSEVAAMRRAAKIAVSAHERAMRYCRPGVFEYEVEAEFLHEFRRNGAHPSYLPIIGSGPNTCVLHYTANRRRLEEGELLLVDAGCELDYYASDVTRTYPVNGRFSAEQRAVYDVVLAAHRAAIDAVGPGRHWNEPHEAALKVICEGLVDLKLLRGSVPALIRTGAYKRFFMHRTGHWLGLDVHDVGDYRVADQWRHLEPGMAMTVEPGIYIPEGTQGAARRWWNIGVRIEDDVVVTRDGHDVLTRGLPSSPEEIEALMGRARH